MVMATKLSRMVAHFECPTLTKSHDPCDLVRSRDHYTETIISPLQQCLW